LSPAGENNGAGGRRQKLLAVLCPLLVSLARPGRQARFEFGDLPHAKGKSQRIDDTLVIVDDVRKNNETSTKSASSTSSTSQVNWPA
jgi:hypothetical protein